MVAFAGSVSLPLSLPFESDCRTAFSISRCPLIPTCFRNFRTLILKASSFMSLSLNGCREQHLPPSWLVWQIDPIRPQRPICPLAHLLKRCLADQSVLSPARHFYTGDQFRLGPVH